MNERWREMQDTDSYIRRVTTAELTIAKEHGLRRKPWPDRVSAAKPTALQVRAVFLFMSG